MNLRFANVFGVLMFVALVCGLAMPNAASNRIATSLQSVFAPVSGPVHWLGGSIRPQRVYVDDAVKFVDAGSDQQQRLVLENRAMKEQLSRLTLQLDALRQRLAERDVLGAGLADLAISARVIGRADGARQVLKLGSAEKPLRGGEVVVCQSNGATGLVGKVMDGVGAANQASVRLITDEGFAFTVWFVRPGGADAQGHLVIRRLNDQPVLVSGGGQNWIRAADMKMDDVRKMELAVGDQVFLAGPETDWPLETLDLRVGTVTAVKQNLLQPLFAEVRIQSEFELAQLREVLVIAK